MRACVRVRSPFGSSRPGDSRLRARVRVRAHAHLWEVADQVAAIVVVVRQHVEEEGLDVVVERLVVEEELREQTQVLAVDLAHVAVHLKHRVLATPVDLVGRRLKQAALLLRRDTRRRRNDAVQRL